MLRGAGARAVVVLVLAGVGSKLLEHTGFPDTEAAVGDFIDAVAACSLGQQYFTAHHLVTARIVRHVAKNLLLPSSPERELFWAAAAAGGFMHALYIGRVSPVGHSRRLVTEWHAESKQSSP
eukprot:jgi/Tetstr1/459196/TSEL_004640.t1